MKKYLIISALLAATALAQAESATTIVTANSCSNLLANFSGSARVTGIVITSEATTANNVKFIDSPSDTLTYVAPAYTSVTTYATNVITTYTNYFGVTQNITNVALVETVTDVAASTNNYPVRFQTAVGTNTSVAYTGVNYYFGNGIWATNAATGTGSATVTITYQR